MPCTAEHLPKYHILPEGFTDGCIVYCSTCDKNVMFLARESLHFVTELEYNLPHMMWAGMTAACMNVSVVDLLTLHLTWKC